MAIVSLWRLSDRRLIPDHRTPRPSINPAEAVATRSTLPMRIEEFRAATARVQGLRYARMAIRRGVETERPRRLRVTVADDEASPAAPRSR